MICGPTAQALKSSFINYLTLSPTPKVSRYSYNSLFLYLLYLLYSRNKIPKYNTGGRIIIPLKDYKDKILYRLFILKEI